MRVPRILNTAKHYSWSVWQVAGSPAHRIPPLFNLPSWILDRGNDEEYFSHLPPAMVVALVAVVACTSQKRPRNASPQQEPFFSVRAMNDPGFDCCFDALIASLAGYWLRSCDEHMRQRTSNLTNMIRRKELHREESLWLLSTLSELRSRGWLSRNETFFIGICLAILLDACPEMGLFQPPDILLLEAVVTLAAISCTPEEPIG
jgi:hypothetical protein